MAKVLRRRYRHKVCGTTTTLTEQAALDYDARPSLLTALYCAHDRRFGPLTEFEWVDG